MALNAVFTAGGRDRALSELPPNVALDDLLPGAGAWEVELGFGKGRYLLRRALERPDRRFLGIELVSKYFSMLRRRARYHGAENLLLVRGEALYLLSAVLPRSFAARLHVYFPDPWPKSRHQKRRLFDPGTVDLVLGVLRPAGELCFATDFLEYGERVHEILRGHPGLTVTPRDGPWPGGARTNYEAKYITAGRPILRLEARLDPGTEPGLHPEGRAGVLAATAPKAESGSESVTRRLTSRRPAGPD